MHHTVFEAIEEIDSPEIEGQPELDRSDDRP